MPITIDKIDVHLDFHIYDVIDFDLLLGYPSQPKLLASHGSPDEKLREIASVTAISFLENTMVKFHPEQNLLEQMTHISLFVSSEPIFFDVAKSASFEEYDSKEIYHLS